MHLYQSQATPNHLSPQQNYLASILSRRHQGCSIEFTAVKIGSNLGQDLVKSESINQASPKSFLVSKNARNDRPVIFK